MGSFPATGADVPWLFNASGTEAQTTRFVLSPIDPFYYRGRFKISIQGGSATRDNLGYVFGDACSITSPTPWQVCPTLASAGTVNGARTLAAVDYRGDVEVFLEIDVNRWLLSNGAQLVPGEHIPAECFNHLGPSWWCDATNQSFIDVTSVTRSGDIVSNDYKIGTGIVSVTVHTIDLRTDTVGYAVANRENEGPTDGLHYLAHKGAVVATRPFVNPYHTPGQIYLGGSSGIYEDRTRSFFAQGFHLGVAPNCAIDTSEKLLCSNILREIPHGHLNYLTGGNVQTLTGSGENPGFSGIGLK